MITPPTRVWDTPNELRLRIRRTMTVDNHNFYHEDVPKIEQVLAVTRLSDSPLSDKFDVTIFIDRMLKLLDPRNTRQSEVTELQRQVAFYKVDQRVTANSSTYHIKRCRMLEQVNETANQIIGDLCNEFQALLAAKDEEIAKLKESHAQKAPEEK